MPPPSGPGRSARSPALDQPLDQLRVGSSATVAVVSYRLGGRDGVSVEAAKWCRALGALGYSVRTVAGEGRADHIVTGLAAGDTQAPDPDEVESALAGADVVVAENICSLPLNPAAAEAVARALRGRAAVLRHHDLAWQRPETSRWGAPPDDPAWVHVTVNELSRRQLAAAGIPATTMYNRFDPRPALGAGSRERARRLASIDPGATVVLQPTRAIPRKGVPAGLRLARALHAHYWLTGEPEDGYAERLQGLLRGAGVPVSRGVEALHPELTMADAYSACDLVALPSSWEGFGNPALEGSMAGRPVAVGRYPVARELMASGLEWLDAWDTEAVRMHLASPDRSAAAATRNRHIAVGRFSLGQLPSELARLIAKAATGGCRDDGGRRPEAGRRAQVQ